MRITFVSFQMSPPDFGGELILTAERLSFLAARGHGISILTAGRPGLPAEEIREGCSIVRSPVINESRLARVLVRCHFAIWAAARSELRADIVHIGSTGGLTEGHDWLGADVVRRSAASYGARVVAVHSLADREEPGFVTDTAVACRRLKVLMAMDAVVGVSTRLYEDLRHVFGDRARLILNGVRDDLFAPLSEDIREAVRASHRSSYGETVFAYLGTVCRRKGFEELAGAFLRGVREGRRWRLWVIGPQSREENPNIAEEEYRHLHTLLAGMGQVSFLGRIDDRRELARLLAAADVLVFPTRREGFGLAPLEAMAAGTPSILTYLAGVTSDHIEDGVSGVYVPVGDCEALAAAMKRLGDDPHQLHEIRQAARHRAQRLFGWTAHIDAWEALYRELGAGRSRC